MKGEQYRKLKHLPKKTKIEEIFTIAEYSRKKEVSLDSIYKRISRVIAKTQKWDDFIAFQHNKKIFIVEK